MKINYGKIFLLGFGFRGPGRSSWGLIKLK